MMNKNGNNSELTSATVNNEAYAYDYDNIGNRTTAQEAAETATAYSANNLNQYTAVGEFTPTYDADGNQTLVKTSTGIRSVEYNAENRPIRFTSSDGSTVIECSYDYMGRRASKKVTENGRITLHHRYLYRGYKNDMYTICEHREKEWKNNTGCDFLGDLAHGTGLSIVTCRRLADIYYAAVVNVGGGAFDPAQNGACKWLNCAGN